MEQAKSFEVRRPQARNFPYIVLVRDVLKRWFLILAVAVAAGVGTYIFTDLNYKPVYQTNATLVVTTRDSTSTIYSNLKSTAELASVLSKLLNSSVLRSTVTEELGLPGFDGSISAFYIEETNLISLQVTASDPRTAFLVAESIIENHTLVTEEVVGDIVLEALQLPQVATEPSNTFSMLRRVQTAMLFAAALCCAGLLFLSYSKHTVRSQEEAEQKLPCWCLGEIPHEKKYKTLTDQLLRRRNGLVITNPAVSFQFVETVRRLRRRVEQYMSEGRILMVTSVAENEGKSTVAVNLALSLMKKHGNVLLVDLDLHKPACCRILEVTGGSYSTEDVLSGNAALSQAVTKEPCSGLSLLLQRTPSLHAEEYLSDKGIQAALRAARSQYSYIVLDLPPLSAVPDVEYVMEYADDALLVVQQNQVRVKELKRAISTLESGKAKLLGCVLNNVYSSGLMRRGGYGYGYGRHGYGKYGYGKYGSTAAPDADTDRDEYDI